MNNDRDEVARLHSPLRRVFPYVDNLAINAKLYAEVACCVTVGTPMSDGADEVARLRRLVRGVYPHVIEVPDEVELNIELEHEVYSQIFGTPEPAPSSSSTT